MDEMFWVGFKLIVVILFVGQLIAPLFLLLVAVGILYLQGTPFCGEFAELEVDEHGNCGENLSWGFYVGVVTLSISFFMALSTAISLGYTIRYTMPKVNARRAQQQVC